MIIRAINYDRDKDKFRLPRLKRVMQMFVDTPTYGKILVLEDCKGRLGVLWGKMPKAIDKYRVESAWEEECEQAENVCHRYACSGETDIFD